MPELIQADARALPFEDASFDLIFTAPPWNELGVLLEARDEMRRVLDPGGRMILLLPHLDSRDLATLLVTDREWNEQVSFAAPAPRKRVGPKYFSPAPLFIARVFNQFVKRQSHVLDPFCGVGTIPKVAERRGHTAVGCDIDPAAIAVGVR